MQQCFRIALWMFLLIGYLHAKPVITEKAKQKRNPPEMCFRFIMADLGFDFLHKDVSCGQNVNFTSPTNIQKPCYAAALENFMKGLEHASINCEDKLERITDTIDSMERGSNKLQNLELAKSSECKWESKQFTNFVKDLQMFVEQLNSENTGEC